MFSFIMTFLVKAQDVQGRVVYLHETDIYTELISLGEQEVITRIPSNHCFEISPDLKFIAVVDPSNPLSLVVYNLDLGISVTHIAEQLSWQLSCDFSWKDNNRIMIFQSRETNQVYEFDVYSSTLNGPISYNIFDLLPNLNGDLSSIEPLPSPDMTKYVYEQCDSITQGEIQRFCTGNNREIIFDVFKDQVVTQLSNVTIIPARPIDTRSYFAWSNSGDFIAYASTVRLVETYNVEQMSNLDMSFLDNFPEPLLLGSSGIRWSPTDQRIGLWAYTFVPTTRLFVHFFATINIDNQIIEVLPLNELLVPAGYNN